MLYKVTNVEKVTYDTTKIRFEGPKVEFKPGQFMMISCPVDDEIVKRAYSISSSPTKDYLEITVREVPTGLVSKILQKVKIGDEFELTGPFGAFFFDEETDKDIILIGCGCGVMPFWSMIDNIIDKNLDVKVKYFVSYQKEHDIVFKEKAEQLIKDNPNIKIYYTLTRDNENSSWQGRHGRIDKEYLAENIGNISGKTFFVCGTIAFANSMKEILLELGVSKDNIKWSAHG
jgi:ferredoxin-NADP reductase